MVAGMKEYKKIMVISPHPDDLDFGCSGTNAKWARGGKEIIYIMVTSGDKGNDDLSVDPESFRKRREAEQKEAGLIVGVKHIVFLRYEDGEVENTQELRIDLVREIRKYRPEVVLTMDPANCNFDNHYLSHRDHRQTAEAVFDAVYPAAGNPFFFPELINEGYLPHNVREMLFFGTANPNVWSDISDTIEIKLKALSCHKSQGLNEEWLKQFISERAKSEGMKKNMAYAEASGNSIWRMGKST
jgi:LmbE family N-acetylglucosaminyl deacetylase